MNRLTLQEMNTIKIVYRYYPEGKDVFGRIVYLFSNKEASVEEKAQGDDTGYYAHKATKKVEECVSKNYLPMEITQAWY